MAAGIFRYGGTPYSIPSSSCADVRAAMNANWAPLGYAVANSCSADPVVVGTVITFTENASGIVSTVSILEMTATPPAPATAVYCTSACTVTLVASESSSGVPYDYAAGGALFGFAFTGVMILYFASLGIGHVVKAVRDM